MIISSQIVISNLYQAKVAEYTILFAAGVIPFPGEGVIPADT
jgi:hypothetical protein